MNRILLFVYFIITFVINSTAQNNHGFKIQIDLLEPEVKSFIEKYDIPGAAVAIINKDSIWIGTYGLADKNKKIPISNRTIFRLGSISKSFIAIAIMQLVDEGKIALNTPVKEIIPEIEMKNNWERDYPVRLIHLLEHTSSIDDVHFNEAYSTTGIQQLPLTDVFNKNPKSRYIRWKPGEFTSYSNDAFSLLGLIIERITDQKFENYIQDNILNKLETTSITYTRDNKNSSLFAQGYKNDGYPLEYIPVLMRPSGGINSNIEDMAKFVKMMLNNGMCDQTSIIDSSTLNKMLFPSSSIPAQEGYKLGYGSGFSSRFVNGYKFFGHGGGLPDFNSMFLIHPESNLGIVILINSNSDYFSYLIKKVVSFTESELNTKNESFKYSKKKFETNDIIGYYSQANYGISLDRFPNYFLSGLTIFSENDSLYSKEFQDEKKTLIHVSGNEYKRNTISKETLYFFKNSDGAIMLSVLGKDFYKKDSAWKPKLDRAILAISVIIILSFLLYTVIWLINRFALILSKKGNRKIHLLPRLVPLLSIIFLLTCMFSLSIWFGDYNNAGKISIVSTLVFTSSILFLLFSLSCIWVSFFKNQSENRIEKIYLRTVSLILVCLSIILYKYEIIGLMLWSY